MDIRRLTIDDYDEIVKLWKRSDLPFKPKGRDSRQAIKKQMDRDPDLFLGDFREGMLVGVIIGSYDGRKGWINRLAVDPEHRRQGIAQLLITRLEKNLEKRGAEVICALVMGSNIKSINLFEKQRYIIDRSILYLSKRKSKDV